MINLNMNNLSTTNQIGFVNDELKYPLNILIVDDEINIRKTLSYCLSSLGHNVTSVDNDEDARISTRQKTVHLAFVDLRLGETSGLELIPELLAESPWMKIVVITAYASLETAVDAMREGAFDYISKPFTSDRIRVVTNQIAKICRLEQENLALKADISDNVPDISWDTKNNELLRVFDTLKKAADSNAIILLQGESGTGKSMIARAVHGWSSRAAFPFGVISCPALPAELLESELFGHARGAFTGAIKENAGKVSGCEGGTLFLDEIGDMTLGIQAKLLRFIQDKEYERLGESLCRKANIRIIVATNYDLLKIVTEGKFREDLYYRLNVISVTLPPLRNRREDVIPLAENFLRHFCNSNHKGIKTLSKDACAWLFAHDWPGNIRELRNIIERAVILSQTSIISCKDLLDKNITNSTNIISPGDRVSLAQIEELHIRKIISNTTSLQEAAEVLGIDQTTLWRKRQALGILKNEAG